MPAAMQFNLSGAGEQEGPSVGVAAGEKVRVRISSMSGLPELVLVIRANGIDSAIPIDNSVGFLSFAGMAGDGVLVRMHGYAESDAVTGIIEADL